MKAQWSRRKYRCGFKPVSVILSLLVIPICASPTRAQDAAALWNSVTQPQFDSTKSATVSNVTIARDRIHIVLTDGLIQFAKPVNGLVFAAVFQGHGHLEITPPNAIEAQQLHLFTKQEAVSLDFTQASLSFSDATYEEIASKVHWTDAPAGSLGTIYDQRQRDRENNGEPLTARLFEGVLSQDQKQTAYFHADLKTSMDWVEASYDAQDPEEIEVGRWSASQYRKGFDTWMHFPANGRGSSDAFANPLAKEPFVIEGYEIEATVTSGADLGAATKVMLNYQSPGERVLVFNLNSNLRIDSVKNAQGVALPFFQAREAKDRNVSYGDYAAVVLPAATEPHGKESLQFHYAGKRVVRQEGTGNYFCPSYGWYPARETSFSSRANFAMTFHTPKNLTLVATGTKTADTKEGKKDVTTWKSEIPLAVAGFAYGDYKEYDQMVGQVHLQIFANRDPDQFLTAFNEYMHPPATGIDDPSGVAGFGARGAASGTLDPAAAIKTMTVEFANNLKLFQDYFGPYPYRSLSVTNIPFSYGQGWPGLLYISVLSFLDATQRHVMGVKDEILLTDYFRAHETSHQWWGHLVGWKSYHDQWMSEGFAQFSGNLYVQFRENPAAYLNRLRVGKAQLLEHDQFGHMMESVGPVWMGERLASSESPQAYNVVVYNKGGYILHMLRMMMLDTTNKDPDHYFKGLMQDFCQTYDNKPASTEDFKAVVEKHMGKWMDVDGNHRMDWFFKQYVYGTGIPHYGLKYEARVMDGKFTVVGTLTQNGVPEGWKDIVPVYVHVQGRDVRVGWLTVTGKTTPLKFVLPTSVDKVSINNDEDMLMVVDKVM